MEKTLGTLNNLHTQSLPAKPSTASVSLSKNEFYQLERGQARRLQAQQGELWITVPGEMKDYLVGAGESFRIPDRKGILVQAMVPSCFYLLK